MYPLTTEYMQCYLSMYKSVTNVDANSSLGVTFPIAT